jgi:hypothetical protein
LEEEPKSLAAWRHEIKLIGRKHYIKMYEDLMGVRVSNYVNFNRAINNYGGWYMFEAIVDSSTRQLTGDPLPYVLKVAGSKWKEDQLIEDAKDEEEAKIKKAKEKTLQENKLVAKNQVLARKVKRKLTI